MRSKVKSKAGCRAKGCDGEREAAAAINANCRDLSGHRAIVAERNARNGKATTDVVVRVMCNCHSGGSSYECECSNISHLFEVKRVESLDIGTAAMSAIREQAQKDGALGILWRRNRQAWRLEVYRAPLGWATYSGSDVWRVLETIVQEAEEAR